MTDPAFSLLANETAKRAEGASGDLLAGGLVATTEALDDIGSWPGYQPTPLRGLKAVAQSMGVARVWYKDEGQRFGVMSFKPLGAGYGVSRIVTRELTLETGVPVTSEDLLSGTLRDRSSRITVACATDGNHGRAVAWAAGEFGCRAVVYLASHVSPGRERAIASYGAEVIRTSGNHDDAVRQAASEASREGWHLVSETANASSRVIAHDILVGYSTLLHEAANQWPADEPPTHMFVQSGVGGLAAACSAYAEARWGHERPVLVVVEPQEACSIYRSVEAGERVAIGGEFDTVMAGLAAGEVSEYAWPLLRDGTDFLVTIGDESAIGTMRLLAKERPPIAAGESGVAGLAAAMLVAQDDEARVKVGLTAESRILTIGTEGATDAAVYERLVGVSSSES